MEMEFFQQLIDAMDRPDPGNTSYRELGSEIVAMLDGEVEILFDQLQLRSLGLAEPACYPVLEFLLAKLASRSRIAKTNGETFDANIDAVLSSCKAIYLDQPEESNVRNYLLGWLASLGIERAVQLFVQLIVESPPKNTRGIVVAFQPLFSYQAKSARLAFPEILDAIQHVETAAAVLDLANFLKHESFVEIHPAGDRRASLFSMLQALTFQLGEIEQGRLPPNADAQTVSEQVDNSVALIIALCNSLGLIGDTAAIPKLQDAMELKHRRIQTEAAAALFRLGEESGKEKLLDMLNEPVTRLRVIAYADELGFLDEIDDDYLADEKRAESELALWLALPAQMGFAPSQVEVLDRRTLHWPSYDYPIDCFLLEYKFKSPAGTFRNIGITGPLTYVFAADLTSHSRLDQYAAFAGWQAAHEDLFEIAYDKACVAYRRETDSRLRDIEAAGYQDIKPQFLGMFFGEQVLVCNASLANKPGQVVSDGENVLWFDSCSEEAPVCAELAYCIYKGRRLLNHFNPEFDENLEPLD